MSARLLAFIAIAVVAAACSTANAGQDSTVSDSDGVASLSGSDQDESSTGDSDGPVNTEAQLLEYAQCMRDQGFDIEDPTVDAEGNIQIPRLNAAGGNGGGPPEGFREARDACSEHLEGLELRRGGAGDNSERQDQLLAFAQCLRDNGVDVDDPDASDPRTTFRDIDRNDPKTAAALEACQEILGGFGAGGRGPQA